MANDQSGCFVPNLGQWEHDARFLQASGAMTVFVEERGWRIRLEERTKEDRPARERYRGHTERKRDHPPARGAALSMSFVGASDSVRLAGDGPLPGIHNYFLGSDPDRWRTGVPRFAAVRYEGMYPGIDVKLHRMRGVPEYDLDLQPGADLSRVVVHVGGAEGLSIAADGSLVIATAVGPLTQSAPKTWQVGPDGSRRHVVCEYVLLGGDRFGFRAPGWSADTSLTIDPGLVWSTYLGSQDNDYAYSFSVDANGVVTLGGSTYSADFPTNTGAFLTAHNGRHDAFITRLDPSKTGSEQFVYSTFLGGRDSEFGEAIAVDANGVVTLAGETFSSNFPTTTGAHDTTWHGGTDVFVSRLDPSKTGAAQLVYSTLLGGTSDEYAWALAVDTSGVMTVAGRVRSADFPTTSNAYDATYHGKWDAFVSQLDPSKTTPAEQLVYSTYLGGTLDETAYAVAVEANGDVIVAGTTASSEFPATSGACDTTHNGGQDAFVSRVDPTKTGTAQLLYSTFLGGSLDDFVYAISVARTGVVTISGETPSTDFPTTSKAYSTVHSGLHDAFVCRLDPSQTASEQIVYSTFLGGSSYDYALPLAVDEAGVITVGGFSSSADFPTTRGACSTTHHGKWDGFVSRLDPRKHGVDQLTYSTYLGGSEDDTIWAVAIDENHMVTVVGETWSADFPTTTGAYDTTYGGKLDAFVGRIDTAVASFTPIGVGCKGNGNGTFSVPPILRAGTGQTGPIVGKSFTAEVVTSPPFTNGAMMYLGFSSTTWSGASLPLDLQLIGVPGCSLYISPDRWFAMSGPNFTAQIPMDLLGLRYYNQALVIDPGANALGFVVTNGAEGYIGAR